MTIAFVAELLEKIFARKIQTGIGWDRLEDDRGDRFRILAKRGAHGGDVVKRNRNRKRGKFRRHARAIGPAVGERAAAGLDEQRVDVAVVAALELDDLVAPDESTRETQTGHGGFGPAVDHAHFLDGGNPTADQLRHFHFERIRDTEADSARGRGANGIDDHVGRVPENGRTPGADVIDVFVAIDVPDFRAGGALDEEWFAAQTAEGADRGIDAAGDASERARE